MKKLFVYLMLMGSLVGLSQVNSQSTTPNGKFIFDPNEVAKEFIRLVDSVRNDLYKNDWFCFSSKDQKRWFDFHTKFDSLASLACKHHNQYLKDMTPENSTDYIVGHGEQRIIESIEKDGNSVVKNTFTYRGKDTLINSMTGRTDYYSKGQFKSDGECCMLGSTPRMFGNHTNKDLAKTILQSFKDSKPHWKVLIKYDYTDMGFDVMFDKNYKTMWVTLHTGNNINTDDSYLYIKPVTKVTKKKRGG